MCSRRLLGLPFLKCGISKFISLPQDRGKVSLRLNAAALVDHGSAGIMLFETANCRNESTSSGARSDSTLRAGPASCNILQELYRQRLSELEHRTVEQQEFAVQLGRKREVEVSTCKGMGSMQHQLFGIFSCKYIASVLMTDVQ
eukprot:1139885-Pelagomonas_calceolata.AAC.5